MVEPLIRGIYGADPGSLSLRATFPQFLEMERRDGGVLLGLKKASSPPVGEDRGGGPPPSTPSPIKGEGIDTASGARYGLFKTLRGGMQRLADELVKQLGITVSRRNTKVVSLTNSSFPEATGGESITADRPPTRALGGDGICRPWQVRVANG